MDRRAVGQTDKITTTNTALAYYVAARAVKMKWNEIGGQFTELQNTADWSVQAPRTVPTQWSMSLALPVDSVDCMTLWCLECSLGIERCDTISLLEAENIDEGQD